MKKLRFKNRNGILYFGIGDTFKSSKLKYTSINKNILVGKYKRGELDIELGLVNTSDCIKVIDLLKDVILEKSKYLKHKTIQAYTSAMKNHLVPYFKDSFVTEIKPIDIKNFQDMLAKNGLKKQGINITRILLREAFDIAILSELILANPIAMVKPPKIKVNQQKKEPFSLDEIDLILAHAKGHIRNFLGIAFFTGMRSGEVLGLRWEDIDFTTATISVRRTIASGVVNSPKTFSSIRDIEMLDKAREYLLAQRLETGMKNGYVFLNSAGKFHNSTYTFASSFKKLLDTLNIKYRSLHNTRHTFASMMLNNAIEPLWVSRTLGHENLNITLKVYAHYMPKKEKMSIEFLEKRYK